MSEWCRESDALSCWAGHYNTFIPLRFAVSLHAADGSPGAVLDIEPDGADNSFQSLMETIESTTSSLMPRWTTQIAATQARDRIFGCAIAGTCASYY